MTLVKFNPSILNNIDVMNDLNKELTDDQKYELSKVVDAKQINNTDSKVLFRKWSMSAEERAKHGQTSFYVFLSNPEDLVEKIVKVPVEVIKEVIKEVPVEVIREVIKEVTVEVVREVPIEIKGDTQVITKEVIKEVKGEVPGEVIKEVKVEKIVEVIKEVINTEEIDKLTQENLKLTTELNLLKSSLDNLGKKGTLMRGSNMSSLYDE
jgi:hypothetical protein